MPEIKRPGSNIALIYQRRSLFLSLFGGLLLFVSGGTGLSAQNQAIPAPFVTGQAARVVIGQSNFSDITAGTSQFRWGATSGIAVAGNKLIIADSSYLAPPNNNRVLIYNDLKALKERLPQAGLPPADVVLGQPDFGSSDPGTSAQRFNQPVGIASDGTRLFISEWGNNRVLIYNRIPEVSGASPDVIVGQRDFTASAFGSGAQGLRRPNSVYSDGTRLFVADSLNNRVLIYNRIPAANGASADVVLGQPNFDANRALPTASNTLSSPMSITTDGQRLIVTDLGNNRVLIYNSIPTQSGASADVVVGQPDFTSNGAGNTQTSLDFPRYAYSDGTRLLIVDSGNNRILIYNQIPTEHGAPADIVIGQMDFRGLTAACGASNFSIPLAVASDGEALYVSDGFNRRVLGFQPGADLVLPNGVVNAASFSTDPQTETCQVIMRQPPLAPGGVAAIFGRDFTDAPAQAQSLPLPTQLGGVRVKINGIGAPIFSISPTQINVQVPFEVTGYSASLEVEKTDAQGRTTVAAAVPVGLAPGAPGLYTASGTGSGEGIIFHNDFTPVTADSPAKPGEELIALATGLGAVSQNIPTGAAAVFYAVGGVTIGGTPSEGQTATIVINGVPYSYTTISGDSLDQVTINLSNLINDNDPFVSATPDIAGQKIDLQARTPGEEGSNISYNAFVPPGGTLTVSVDSPIHVPGNITFSGTPAAGQIISIGLSGTAYTYLPVASDTLATVLNQVVEQINSDLNVVATADVANAKIHLELRDPGSGLNIPYTASVEPAGSTLTAATDDPQLTPGNAKAVNTVTATIGKPLPLVPGSIHVVGTAEPGHTATVILQGTTYLYTTEPGDTLQSITTKLADLINADPNVSATADTTRNTISLALKSSASGLKITFEASVSGGSTLFLLPQSNETTNSTTASVNFAGLVGGHVGLYQVIFTVPSDQTANPAAILTLLQNLIVFGSVTGTNIISNAVTFPVQP
ncbi:MAG: hypothetical protein HYX72_05765 [Acidobacteria bacterium]|nr:hypothetical protein [Acidobacteriota bacterium]